MSMYDSHGNPLSAAAEQDASRTRKPYVQPNCMCPGCAHCRYGVSGPNGIPCRQPNARHRIFSTQPQRHELWTGEMSPPYADRHGIMVCEGCARDIVQYGGWTDMDPPDVEGWWVTNGFVDDLGNDRAMAPLLITDWRDSRFHPGDDRP